MKSNVLLLGPRQVGKSTLCRSLGAALYVDLADEASFLGYAKDPTRLRRDDEAAEVLGTYGQVYLREEIQAEAATRNLGGYARFLDTIALASGQWVNYTKLSSDVEVPKETVRRFVQLLDDTLLAHRLPPFRLARSTSRRLVQRDRVLLFDVGVRNALLGLHRHPLGPVQSGAIFEQWTML